MILVFFSTQNDMSVSESQRSISGVDYLVNSGSVDMLQDVNRIAIEVTLLQVWYLLFFIIKNIC